MAQENREAYIAWLRDEIEKHCNSEGRYEAYWDYNDSITPDQLFNAMEHFEREGYASPLAYLEVSLVEDYYFTTPMEEALLTAISQDAKSAPDGLGEYWDESDDIWGDLEAAGYQGIDANLDDLLSRSSFNVNVFFATEAERNFDMGSIVNAFGNDYREPRLEDVDAEDLDNALSYLVNQQGHSVAEVYGNGDNTFIRSVREEIDENSSEAMSELCALVRMDGQQMLDFIEKRNEAKDSLVLPKDCATMGIFNQWAGCGGMLDIQLEKDAVLPLSMVRGFQVEGQPDPDGYTVNETYGLVGSAWMPVHYCEGTETGVKEDYSLALDKARGADAIEAHGSDEPVSLKAAARESREASAALAGNDAHENIGQDAR
ncbi:hypothetical protein HIU56_02985 [Enterococcus faecium]|uniref:hypothetical protein n=1 Tax=Enterococcus faecium TaxID=1352 RepID=UPI001C458A0C|nr:hypothetical protein [Enterococcus faecium]